jgi:hypothetical protein
MGNKKIEDTKTMETLKAARVEDTWETILPESLKVSMLQFRAGQLQKSGGTHNSLRTRQRAARVYVYGKKGDWIC